LATLESLGLKPVINAAGNLTNLGGSVLSPEVVDAMREVSTAFVDMNELMQNACQRVAELLDVEAALITSGAAAGLSIATAACMTGNDRTKATRLPDTGRMKNEVLIQRGHRSVYDQAFLLTGARFTEVGHPFADDEAEVDTSIEESTAALAYTLGYRIAYIQKGALSLESFGRLGRRRGIPLVLDAAAMLPPLGVLKEYAVSADLVSTSGGKALGGPNDTGILLGKKELIQACSLNAFPNDGIGRAMKVSKEQIVGLVTALEMYLKRDEAKELESWNQKIGVIVELLKGVKNLQTEVVFPDEIGRPVPRLFLHLHHSDKSAQKVIGELKQGNPRIMTFDFLTKAYYPDSVIIDPTTLAEGEAEIIGKRLQIILS